MTLDQQEDFLQLIDSEVQTMRAMLLRIQEEITKYPVYTQMAFIRPIKTMILEAMLDAANPDNEFLNNYDGGDTVEIK